MGESEKKNWRSYLHGIRSTLIWLSSSLTTYHHGEMEEDRLSSLPKFILHDILSRLPQKDAARTSVLSKAWAETWSTFPVLSISERQMVGREINDFDFINSNDYLRKRKIFCDKVERTLLRFCNQGLAIKKFKLCVNNFRDLSKDVDLWLKLVSETGVEVFELEQPSLGVKLNEIPYILPTSVFEAKSLTKLDLRGVIRVDLTFINHSVNFFSLQVLFLECVCLENEQDLNHLISRCPLIEDITLGGCSLYSSGETNSGFIRNPGIKSLNLQGLPRLKSVDVRGIQDINVDSPCLEKLSYSFRQPGAPYKIEFDRCRNLKKLCLGYPENTIITQTWLHELFLKFPILESLDLYSCMLPERINISSDRLKALMLSPCSNVKEINIAAPNLLSPCSNVKPAISFLMNSSNLKVNVETEIDFQSLCSFYKFIIDFTQYHVLPSISISLYIHWPIAVEFNPIILHHLPTLPDPPRIKHLILRNVPDNEALYLLGEDQKKALYLIFVNILLLCCCPTTISLSSASFGCNKAFIEVFYEVLIGKNKDEYYCNSGHTIGWWRRQKKKCWWHNLKSVNVTCSMKNSENVDFKTMLDAFETSANMDTISFNFEF